MKGFMIAAPNSNSGKTLVTMGITRAIKNRGMDVSAFKTGPDFIDRDYLGYASGKVAGNLDLHMMGFQGVHNSLYLNNGEYAVIEGVMGYFDGIYNTYQNSSYHISEKLDIPAILVYSPVGEMFSAVPKIKGMVDFSKGRIKGIIFNKTSESTYNLLKEIVEEHIDIKVLGFIPKNEKWNIENRYLGLIQAGENEELEELIEDISNLIEKNIDLDSIIQMAREIQVESSLELIKHDITVAIALDKAFNFYYKENIKILEKSCNLVYFSPLYDKKLPRADLVIIGGGYPELFKEELSLNIEMKESIMEYIEDGGYLYGEGGGLMYLSKEIEGYPMVGVFSGNVEMKTRLQNFGYVNIQLKEDNILGKVGATLKGQEIHYSKFSNGEDTIFKISKPLSKREWECGYSYKNTLASYQHINFLGNMDAFNYLLKLVKESKERSNVY